MHYIQYLKCQLFSRTCHVIFLFLNFCIQVVSWSHKRPVFKSKQIKEAGLVCLSRLIWYYSRFYFLDCSTIFTLCQQTKCQEDTSCVLWKSHWCSWLFVLMTCVNGYESTITCKKINIIYHNKFQNKVFKSFFYPFLFLFTVIWKDFKVMKGMLRLNSLIWLCWFNIWLNNSRHCHTCCAKHHRWKKMATQSDVKISQSDILKNDKRTI